ESIRVKSGRQRQTVGKVLRRDSVIVVRDDRIEVEHLEDELRGLRRAKALLEGSRDHYLDLYVNAPAAHVTFDPSGAIRHVNHAAVALFGISARKLVGSSFFSLL